MWGHLSVPRAGWRCRAMAAPAACGAERESARPWRRLAPRGAPGSLFLSRFPGLCPATSLPRWGKVYSGPGKGAASDGRRFPQDLPGGVTGLRAWRGLGRLIISLQFSVCLKKEYVALLTAVLSGKPGSSPFLSLHPPPRSCLSTFHISPSAFREVGKKTLAVFDIVLLSHFVVS